MDEQGRTPNDVEFFPNDESSRTVNPQIPPPVYPPQNIQIIIDFKCNFRTL